MRWCLFTFVLMLLPLVALSQPVKTAKWTILPLAHPDAKLLVGVDWRRVLESGLGPVILNQVKQGGHPLLGFLESIENVDRLLVSSPGAGEQEGRAPLLVVGEGRFALARIRAMAKADGAVSRKYNDVELLVPPGATSADLHFALLDGQTILFGDGASVKASIDRWQRAESANERNPLFFRAVTFASTQEIWAVIQDPSDSLGSLGIAATDLSQQVESLELGLSVSNALVAALYIKTANEEAAQMLASGLPALLQLAALTYTNQPSLTQVSRRLKVLSEGTLVKMGFTLEGKLLEQSLNELRAASAPPLTTETQRLTTPGAAVAASAGNGLPAAIISSGPQQRKVVRIVGMDEGVKEIPWEPKQPD